jgi:hypothetical protein
LMTPILAIQCRSTSLPLLLCSRSQSVQIRVIRPISVPSRHTGQKYTDGTDLCNPMPPYRHAPALMLPLAIRANPRNPSNQCSLTPHRTKVH